jgi:hypothetical protein
MKSISLVLIWATWSLTGGVVQATTTSTGISSAAFHPATQFDVGIYNNGYFVVNTDTITRNVVADLGVRNYSFPQSDTFVIFMRITSASTTTCWLTATDLISGNQFTSAGSRSGVTTTPVLLALNVSLLAGIGYSMEVFCSLPPNGASRIYAVTY